MAVSAALATTKLTEHCHHWQGLCVCEHSVATSPQTPKLRTQLVGQRKSEPCAHRRDIKVQLLASGQNTTVSRWALHCLWKWPRHVVHLDEWCVLLHT